jgi:hypothetical protein
MKNSQPPLINKFIFFKKKINIPPLVEGIKSNRKTSTGHGQGKVVLSSSTPQPTSRNRKTNE